MSQLSSKDQLKSILRQLLKLKIVLFVALVAAVYGYIILKIGALSSVQPSQSAISMQDTTNYPHVDPVTVEKIEQLQNNSVSVQALFNQARQNPFSE